MLRRTRVPASVPSSKPNLQPNPVPNEAVSEIMWLALPMYDYNDMYLLCTNEQPGPPFDVTPILNLIVVYFVDC